VTGNNIFTGSHFMHGDDACAEGAIAANCTFFAGYPITPSTEIAERLSRRLPQTGGVFVQMEDELASMAAIIGASAAGSRSMTATSGPGFSLMMENLGLAVMMEIPCVMINIQRGSPSTGLPTMAGQGDVMQARWGSHGDYAIIALSPWSPQEMFDLTIAAFNLADRFRVPVIILADEVVGHMVERVNIPPGDQISHWPRKLPNKEPGNGFKPFKVDDDDLVPPIAHAGEGYGIHFTGLTHDELGYPAMTAEDHHHLVTRLIAKIEKNKKHILRSESYQLDDAEIALVAYGATARTARRAIREVRKKGIKAGLLRLISLWPFNEGAIRKLADQVDSFIVPEINLGQISLEVERVARRPVTQVNHAGGALIPPEPIIEAIEEVAVNGRS
jgi:2-oxoglutarate ferredoxin oxidoreductase subunit alpha